MSSRMPIELTNAAIERMLESRAGSAAPAGLVPAIGGAIEQAPQRSPGWLTQVRSAEHSLPRGWLVAAVLALIALAIATAVIGSRLLEPPNQLVVVPVVPSPSALPSSPAVTVTPAATPPASPSSEPTPTPAPPSSPAAPPPNGPLIVYAVAKDRVDVFTLDPASGRRIQLGTLQKRSTFTGQSIRWAADRQHAFVFADSDSIQAVVDVSAREIDPFNLPPPEGRHVLSPTGDRVASLEGSTFDGLTLKVWDLDGNELVKRPLPEIREGQLRMFWAPDGKSLLVNGCGPCDPSLKEQAPDQHYHLFRVPLDGGPVQPLLDEPWWIGAAAWSPDGSAIAYESPCAGDPCADPGLSVLRLADGVSTRLTSQVDTSPVWSPDGSRIAFVRFGGAGAGAYVMDADGRNVTRLTTSSNQADGGGDRDVDWSPDGRSILLTRGGAGYGDLYVVPATGGTPRLLVKSAVADW
jgi:dipeptidyl aminopeptidase/acylaminoacyl peptidase